MGSGIVSRNNICLKIDFEKDSDNPQRVFESMSHLISSFEDFHSCLLSAISSETTSKFLLSDVKEGSIESWLCPVIDGEEDSKANGRLTVFLNRCTDKIISFIEDKNTISDIDEILLLEQEIADEAEELKVEKFPNVFSLDKHRLLKGYSKLASSTKSLNEVDEAYLRTKNDNRRINKGFNLSEEELQVLLVDRIVKEEVKEVLIIKKADFIGRSMWDFLRNNVKISAKFSDEEWLSKFHSREKIVSPGDALFCDLLTYTSYDKANNKIDVKYTILKVHKKIEYMYNQLGFKYEE